MTISDLIDYLGQFPPDTRVFVDDDEAEQSTHKGDYVTIGRLLTADDDDDDDAAPSPQGHEWQRSRFAGNTTCARCGLMPLDDDDLETPCEPAR